MRVRWTSTLSGISTYTGPTTINGGTLLVTGSIATSATTVNSGGTLGGTGSIAGLITVKSGGHLAPGASIGPLTANGGLTLASGSLLDFELGAPGQRGQVAVILCHPCAGTVERHVGVGPGAARALTHADAYVTVVTKENPQGEIRGQVVRRP